jgi:hypothetical protein
MAYFQGGRTVRLAVVPEWDRVSAFSFKLQVRISAYSPFAYLLVLRKGSPGPHFISVSSIRRFQEAFKAHGAPLTAVTMLQP